jgi:hypothetical protein
MLQSEDRRKAWDEVNPDDAARQRMRARQEEELAKQKRQKAAEEQQKSQQQKDEEEQKRKQQKEGDEEQPEQDEPEQDEPEQSQPDDPKLVSEDPNGSWQKVTGVAVSTEQLTEFYTKHDASKLSQVHTVQARYHDDAAFLFATLKKKYGAAPVPTKAGQRNIYRVLEIARDAPPEEIGRSYRRLSRRFHVDKWFTPDVVSMISAAPDGKERLQALRTVYKMNFQAVAKAYSILRDPQQRKEWDSRHPDAAYPTGDTARSSGSSGSSGSCHCQWNGL